MTVIVRFCLVKGNNLSLANAGSQFQTIIRGPKLESLGYSQSSAAADRPPAKLRTLTQPLPMGEGNYSELTLNADEDVRAPIILRARNILCG